MSEGPMRHNRCVMGGIIAPRPTCLAGPTPLAVDVVGAIGRGVEEEFWRVSEMVKKAGLTK